MAGPAASQQIRQIWEMNEQAQMLDGQGNYPAARRLYERAIALMEQMLPPGDLNLATVRQNFAGTLERMGDFPAARALYERVLEVRERMLGMDDPAVARTLNHFGRLFLKQGELDAARTRLERAAAIQAQRPGLDEADAASTQHNLAYLSYAQGDYPGARRLYEQALAIRERVLTPDDMEIAATLNGLAGVLDAQSDAAAAVNLYRRALAIQTSTLPPDHPEIATTLSNLVILLHRLGAFAEALPLAERALAIRERTLGPDHADVALSLSYLAAIREALGEPSVARPLYERALRIQERTPGDDNLVTMIALNGLAGLLQEEGDLTAARPLFERVLAAHERMLGSDHLLVARDVGNVAAAMQAVGDSARARPLLIRAGQTFDRAARRVLPTLSPAEQYAFVSSDLWVFGGVLLSLSRPGALDAEAYAVVAGWKGLLFDGLRRQAAVATLGTDPAFAGDVAALQVARTRVAFASQNGAPADTLAAREAVRERLERALARALPPGALTDVWAGGGLDALRAALPPGVAFVDVVRYVRWVRGRPEGWEQEGPVGWRYAAVVTAPGAAGEFVDLGRGDSLDAAVAAWRDGRRRAGPATAALAAAVWEPVAAALPPEATRVWVSPDGDLARVPWAALAEARSAGVLVAQTPSARALLAALTRPSAATGNLLLAVGGVDFGAPPAGADSAWTRLAGTAAEVRDVATLARASGHTPMVLGGTAATPGGVAAAIPGAAYVHLATHGFFGGESRAAYASPGGVASPGGAARGVETGVQSSRAPAEQTRETSRSPLAESGLVLAGANAGPQGTLTAEEFVGVDLSSARLVVLSACDTGRGAEVTGQGVLGLQAAIGAAGARSLLMSLWPVPDEATAALMAAFYRGLWADGLGPAAALRAAQVEVRESREHPEWAAPVYWAAWVLVGDAW